MPWAKPAVKAVGDEPSVALLEERLGQHRLASKPLWQARRRSAVTGGLHEEEELHSFNHPQCSALLKNGGAAQPHGFAGTVIKQPSAVGVCLSPPTRPGLLTSWRLSR